jgi:hypothetical protein
MEKIKIDLFRLHDINKDAKKPKGWISAYGKNLENELKRLILIIADKGISETELIKHLMKKFQISYPMSERLVYIERECEYIRRKWFPLVFIKELLKLSNGIYRKYEIQDNIEFLKVGSSASYPIKAVKSLTENLCKIAGARAADGTLHDSKNYGTYIGIVDKHKSNLEAFSSWILETFGVNLKPKKSRYAKDMWQIAFKNKIIGRYLNKIFGFNYGEKTYDVREPVIIKKAPLRFRKAFALGFLTFEGGVGIKSEIELVSKSKDLRDSIYEILTKSNVKSTCMLKEAKGGLWRLWSNVLSKDEVTSWLELFECKTEKWFKLYEYAYGFQGKVSSFEDAKNAFCFTFPHQPASKTSVEKILKIIKLRKETWRYAIEKEIEGMKSTWAGSLKYYINILERANVIKTRKGRFGKKKSFGTIIRDVYIYNPDIKTWKVPYRPWLENEVSYVR